MHYFHVWKDDVSESMGNRAVVVFKEDETKNAPGVYLPWEGGPGSVLGFLCALRERGWTRQDYASARFVQVVGEYFDADADDDSGLSVGLLPGEKAREWGKNCDNGLYVVTQDYERKMWVVKNGRKTWKIDLASAALPALKDEYDSESIRRITEGLGRVRSDRKLAAQKRANEQELWLPF